MIRAVVTAAYTLCAITLLGGCAAQPLSIDEARQLIMNALPLRSYSSLSEVAYYPGQVVCGLYETADDYGGSNRPRPFVIVGQDAMPYAKPLDTAIYCSEDPASSLQIELGIGPVESSNTALMQVRSDLTALSEALEAAVSELGYYPGDADWQSTLTGASGKAFIESVPTDPWGNRYQYYVDPFGGSKGEYALWTLGADVAEGGAGPDADIYVKYLRYIEHVAGL